MRRLTYTSNNAYDHVLLIQDEDSVIGAWPLDEVTALSYLIADDPDVWGPNWPDAGSITDYGHELPPKAAANRAVTHLASLEELLTAAQADEYSLLELDALPTFGGPEPDDTYGVFSWDDRRLLVHTPTGLAIEERPDLCVPEKE